MARAQAITGSRSRVGVLLVLSATLAGGIVGTAHGQAPVEVHMVTEMLLSPGGRMQINEYLWDPVAGALTPRQATRFADAEVRHQPREGAIKLQKLGVIISDRWDNNNQARGTITYRAAADLTKSQRNFSRDVMDDFVDKNLGHAETPNANASTQGNVAFRPPSQFGGGAAEAQEQYTRDGINEIGRDDDNVLFTTHISVPHDPVNDPIIRALRMSSGSCTMKSGRWFCPLFLIEGDIFFRSRQTVNQGAGNITIRGFFEDVDLLDRQILMTNSLKFNEGHVSDAWQHSVQSDGRREVGAQTFPDFSNRIWEEVRDGDDLLYDNPDPEERRARGAPTLRPIRDSAISVNELEPLDPDDRLTARQNLFRLNQFAETNLRGYTKKTKMVVDFFEGDSQNKKDRIIRLTGFVEGRETILSNGDPGDRAYRVSHLSIPRAKDWKKLRDRVRDNGEVDMVIRDTQWDRALMTTVCVTGYTSESSGKSKVCERYYYVYQNE